VNDVILNKIQSIQRCIRRAREEYAADPAGFFENYSRQDAAILNVVRACDSAIDLANHLVREHQLGIPVSSADSFQLLQAEGLIPRDLAERMRKMVGFRNLTMHQYWKIDLEIVESVILRELDHLILFTDSVHKREFGSEKTW
jgi:uncharacterized protein YutE (UPF0331/DUF86 family)